MVKDLCSRPASWELLGSGSTSVMAFFSFPLFSPEVHSALPHKMRRCFTASFGKPVGLRGPGSISLRLFQAHYYSGKPERVTY